MPVARELLHATVVAVDGRAGLIRGPSGSGKSDLALRCLDHAPSALVAHPALLVADDQVWVEPRAAGLWAVAPEAIRGLLEVRGLGIRRVPFVPEAALALVVEIVARERIERLPEPQAVPVAFGIYLPLLQIHAFDPSAPVKLLLALLRNSEAR